jgi:Ca2+-binding RTX toxin-like protein/pimeloyl-ACP methyl ester carboxylesterase
MLLLTISVAAYPTTAGAALECNGKPATLSGTAGADTLQGTAGADIIAGGGGNDTIDGLDGDDLICGDDGDDTIVGRLGTNTILGGDGNDIASYQTQGSFIDGHLGYDGGPGRVIGGSTIDTLRSIEELEGTNFDDYLAGGPGVNRLLGAGGRDTFYFRTGDTGDDVWIGGEGNDMASYVGSPVGVVASLDTQTGAVEGYGTDALMEFESFEGSFLDDQLSGDSNANFIYDSHVGPTFEHPALGMDSDVLTGFEGPDILYSSGGGTLDGGDGNDTLYSIDLAPVQVIGGAGNDGISPRLQTDYFRLENSSYSGGSGNDAITGDGSNDLIYGDDGDDSLNGFGGDDVIDGGPGLDQAEGHNGLDSCIAVEISSACATEDKADDSAPVEPIPWPETDLEITLSPVVDQPGVYRSILRNNGPTTVPYVRVVFFFEGQIIEAKGNCFGVPPDSAATRSAPYCWFENFAKDATETFRVKLNEGSNGSPVHMAAAFPTISFSNAVLDRNWDNNVAVLGEDGAPPANEKLPIVFVPGVMGSHIGCKGGRELWPNLPFPRIDLMKLQPDGVTNSARNACTATARATGEILNTGYGYKSAIEFLDGLPRKTFLYGYDWRKSPLLAVPGLDALVDKAMSKSNTDQVVLMAHSMGGLVSRAYVEEHLEKVDRVVTIGTPFLGAPKPWLTLFSGETAPGFNELDLIVDNEDLMSFARNATGLYFLYPSEKFISDVGGWIIVPPAGNTLPLTAAEVLALVDGRSGQSPLLQQSYDAHRTLLELLPTDIVDWQMVVSTGVKTPYLFDHSAGPGDDVIITFGNGDGTVPTLSAAMGNIAPEAVHYVCGAEHGEMAGHSKVKVAIRAFLLYGDPVKGRLVPCPLP